MNRLSKFLALPPPRRRPLIKAAVLVGLIRVGLTVLPFRVVRRLAGTKVDPKREPGQTGGWPVERIIWAVAEASRHIPGAANCLVRALAAQALLARNGHAAELHFGAARNGTGSRISAHAWLEYGGRVLIGASERDRYIRLTASGRETS